MIETERLVLRQWRDGDLRSLHALNADAEVMRHLGPRPSLAELEQGIARNRRWQAELGHCMWPIERRSDRRFIGFCGLKPGPADSPAEGCLELGWRLERPCWGQGYAREAAQASLDWAWANLDLPQVVALTTIGNTRSWRLMVRLGMTRDPGEDFDHPDLAVGDPLRRHIIYRIRRPL